MRRSRGFDFSLNFGREEEENAKFEEEVLQWIEVRATSVKDCYGTSMKMRTVVINFHLESERTFRRRMRHQFNCCISNGRVSISHRTTSFHSSSSTLAPSVS